MIHHILPVHRAILVFPVSDWHRKTDGLDQKQSQLIQKKGVVGLVLPCVIAEAPELL